MKNKTLSAVSAVMLFIPWTILPLRSNFQWALDYADIIIPCYALFMVFSGAFTAVSYFKSKVQNNLMKICLVVNGIYAVGGAAAILMIVLPKIM